MAFAYIITMPPVCRLNGQADPTGAGRTPCLYPNVIRIHRTVLPQAPVVGVSPTVVVDNFVGNLRWIHVNGGPDWFFSVLPIKRAVDFLFKSITCVIS
jgi:hypothetical protein